MMYTKVQAGYRQTIGARTCDRCRYYVDAGRTGQCDIVRGVIFPEDTCDLWEGEHGIIKRGRRIIPLDMHP
jgi:hypothetical protein